MGDTVDGFTQLLWDIAVNFMYRELCADAAERRRQAEATGEQPQ